MSEAAAEDKIRPITKIVKLGAIAIIAFPMINATSVHIKTGRTAKRFVSLTSMGPQIAKVNAYKVTS